MLILTIHFQMLYSIKYKIKIIQMPNINPATVLYQPKQYVHCTGGWMLSNTDLSTDCDKRK